MAQASTPGPASCVQRETRLKATRRTDGGSRGGNPGGRAGIEEEAGRLTGKGETEGGTRWTAVCGILWFLKRTLELVSPCVGHLRGMRVLSVECELSLTADKPPLLSRRAECLQMYPSSPRVWGGQTTVQSGFCDMAELRKPRTRVLGDLVIMCVHVRWCLYVRPWCSCLSLVFTWESGGEPSTFPMGELREQQPLTQTCL